jgi:hypothetical protein
MPSLIFKSPPVKTLLNQTVIELKSYLSLPNTLAYYTGAIIMSRKGLFHGHLYYKTFNGRKCCRIVTKLECFPLPFTSNLV